MKVKFIRCNSSNLANVPVVDGQLIYVTNTGDMYIDVGEGRIKQTDTDIKAQVETNTTELTNIKPMVADLYEQLGNIDTILDEINGEQPVTPTEEV